jgi:hypothetical protein
MLPGMTTKSKGDPAPPKKPEANELTPQERTAACGEEVRKVLEKHGCRLQPYLAAPESVGTDGAKAILRADVAIVPA